MNELKPCPFCGGESLLRDLYINGVANTKHYIRECHHCKATFAHWFRSIKKANEAWNRRHQPESKPLTLEELRQMDGEPVWIEKYRDDDLCCGGWALPDFCDFAASKGRVRMWWPGSEVQDEPLIENYGKTWLAYGNRPKEVKQDG